MNSVFLKKYIVLLLAVLCCIECFTQDTEILLSSNQVYPLCPVFVKVTTPTGNKPEKPIALDQNGQKLNDVHFIELSRFKYKNDKIVEKWFLALLPEQLNQGKIFCVLPTTKKQIDLSILPVPDDLNNDFEAYKANKLTMLAGILLERERIPASIVSLNKRIGKDTIHLRIYCKLCFGLHRI